MWMLKPKMNYFQNMKVTESIVKEVSEFYITTKSKKARTNVFILQKQADSVRIEFECCYIRGCTIQ
jgi:hypothetical protein